jgi:glycosyltransferase involved in cell wall biosynthesis/dTDP-4-dehydrorhamnose reductase
VLIGNGVIANRFCDYALKSNYLIFAGSINDFAINDDAAFQNEEAALQLALADNPDVPFIYFSSCSILDPEVGETPYVLHKIRMEKLLQSQAKFFLIFRLPEVVGLSGDESNLVNFLVDAISNKKPFEISAKAQKNLIDIDNVHTIADEIIKSNKYSNSIINIASTQKTSIYALIQNIEQFLGLKARFDKVEKGSDMDLDISEIQPLLSMLNINFDENYIPRALEKYFGHLIHEPIKLSVIVPTYNEELGIHEFYRRTKNVLNTLSPRFSHEIIFVNDYSTDKTGEKLDELASSDNTVKVINFSRNFGNQYGIAAGLDYSIGDIAIIIDDDLQDPPEVMLNLISKWDDGYKVVYGVRPKRRGVNPLFKIMAKMYYRVINSLSETDIPKDTGDFRLLDRVVINMLRNMKEENRYYRGMVAWVGFPQVGVLYERDKRFQGVSTFSFRKYVTFALSGLTSFTDKPLYVSFVVGLLITAVSFVFASGFIFQKLINSSYTIRGWTSLAVIVLFFCGVQLLSIGVLGVYLSKIYREVKDRPLYIVESTKNLIRLSKDIEKK